MSLMHSQPIKEYAVGIYDGPHATPKETSEGPIFLGIKDFTEDGRLNLTDIRHVSEEEYPKWTRRVTPMPGDIVFTYEATLHRYAIIPEGFRGCLGRRVALVRPDKTKVEPRYLLYYFLAPKWRALIEGEIITGATVDRIPIARFPDFPVELPSISIQRKIAAILSAYDDLIENNLRRIALLEEAARLLYQEWFVRFRFPGYEHTKLVDGMPKGATILTLKDICVDVRDSVEPKLMGPNTPYIGLEHMPRRSIALSDWGKSEDITSSKFKFSMGDILFGKIRPYFHKVGVAFIDGVCSTDAIVIRPKINHYYELTLMTVSSDDFVSHAVQSSTGTKMPRANLSALQEYPVVIPSMVVLRDFSNFISSQIQQIRVLTLQNQKLKQARDLLLPKLMSGEVSV